MSSELRISPDSTETPWHAAQDDVDCIRRAQAGDRGALAQIVTAWQDRIYNTMRKMACDEHEAMDLTQEAFGRAIERLASFRGESAPFSWMYRIAMNVALGRLRQRKRRRTFSASGHDTDDGGDGVLDRAPDASAGPAQRVESRERGELVRQALQRLDEQQRALLVMRDVDGMDYQQIADLLEAPLGTIKSRIFRARLALRDELKDYMSQVRDMADELDEFEAQLIAYLDGELSPADALALEQKLAAYPQHRGLMEELRQQRELLLSLPSEAAPSALKSLLRAQVAQAGGGVLSHQRLYRIAASILLMLGAGIVVYHVLPQRGAEAPQFAIAMKTPTSVALTAPETESLAAATDRVASKIDSRRSDVVAGVALAQAQQARQPMFVNSSNVSSGRTVINVASDNPTVLQAEIGRLLRENRIAYSQETEIPAEVTLTTPELTLRDSTGRGAGVAGKSEGPSLARSREEKGAAGGRIAENAKDTDRYANAKSAPPADEKLDQQLARSDKQYSPVDVVKQSNAKPAAPAAAPTVVAAPAPNAAAPVAQAAADHMGVQRSLTQQVLVAHNVSSGDVAQIELALRQRQVGQKLNYRVTDTSNSQMAAPVAMSGSISKLSVVAATQPVRAMPPAATTPARLNAPLPPGMPASQQPATQQAEPTLDLLIVVEPDNK